MSKTAEEDYEDGEASAAMLPASLRYGKYAAHRAHLEAEAVEEDDDDNLAAELRKYDIEDREGSPASKLKSVFRELKLGIDKKVPRLSRGLSSSNIQIFAAIANG